MPVGILEDGQTFKEICHDRRLDIILEAIAEQGWACMPDLRRIVLNTAMRSEREQNLGAAGPRQ